MDVYNPSAVGAGGALRNNPGFPRLFYSSSVDPATGDLTVVETDPFSPCDSQAPAFPPTDLNCPSFGAGHHSLYDFSWNGSGFKTYPDDTAVPAPAGAPATMFLKSDATTPDSGDGSNPIGALTYGTAPTEMIVRHSATRTVTPASSRPATSGRSRPRASS